MEGEKMKFSNQPMTKAEATEAFRRLVARYGLQWTSNVPRYAWNELARVNQVLDERDRREALGR
jgi:hypothetical protein